MWIVDTVNVILMEELKKKNNCYVYKKKSQTLNKRPKKKNWRWKNICWCKYLTERKRTLPYQRIIKDLFLPLVHVHEHVSLSYTFDLFTHLLNLL